MACFRALGQALVWPLIALSGMAGPGRWRTVCERRELNSRDTASASFDRVRAGTNPAYAMPKANSDRFQTVCRR